MLTFLLMCNYTEESSETINQALTCMKTYFSQENILLNCSTGSKQTENTYLWKLNRASTHCHFFSLLNKAVKNTLNTMLSPYISA